MEHSIELVVQPPSPKITKGHNLPPINTMYSLSLDDMSEKLPIVCLNEDNTHEDQHQKLNTLEPPTCMNIISPTSNTSSPQHMGLSSPSLSSVSAISPLISPISDSLLVPPDMEFRRSLNRSVSNNPSPCASPITSPMTSPCLNYRSLSEPPFPQEIAKPPIFTPKRKRGRPPNVSKPETQESFTFIQPTVWDVKHHTNHQLSDIEKQLEPPETSTSINTFTSTNMDMTLSIPKKKRGRKPKNQLAGNSCFVWKDLTAPRGANKKKPIRLPERSLLPAVSIPRHSSL